jgi:hypothetical protein
MLSNPSHQWESVQGQQCLVIVFAGHLSAEDAKTGARRMRQIVEAAPGPVRMIWDCTRMTGYDPEARTGWQAAIQAIRSKIAGIWLVSDSPTLRMGAFFVGTFSRIDVKAVARRADIRL